MSRDGYIRIAREATSALCLFLLLLVGYLVYTPGLSGDFLFDDFPNLAPLGQLGGVQNWQSFSAYISSGFSGPTGRPLALASFLLDDNTWPSQAYSFKLTNLHVHLLCGLFLAWSTLLLMRVWGVEEKRATWIALLNMGLWLLHPMMVSTTLYIVQRMAQLAALFMFVGLLGYLHGRLLLVRRPQAAYVWMSLSLALGTLLATLSKENGALLPLLVLVVEYCLPASAHRPRPDWRWRLLFLWVPTLTVLAYLTQRINFAVDIWPNRNFNQPERLMTETRILWDYLYQLLVPRVEGRGLFQDGYTVSRGWLSPPTTLVATLSLAGLAAAAMLLRRRWPAFSLAVLFFLASHLIESSVIGLELYFEHRNYAATAFLFLPVALALLHLGQHARVPVVVLVCVCLLALLAGLTWHRASLWGDNTRLQTYWAVTSPESPRAQNWLAIQLFEQGRTEEGLEFLEQANHRMPESSLLTMQWLLQRVTHGMATEADFRLAMQQLAQQRFDAQTISGMRILTGHLVQQGARSEDRRAMLALVQALDGYPHFQQSSVFRRFSPYFKGLLLLAEGDIQPAMLELSMAMKLHSDADVAFSIVAHLGSAGYPAEGLQLLEKMQSRYESDKHVMNSQAAFHNSEMQRLEQVLKEDIARLPLSPR